jgi:uncharacterized DUF497 family protein
MDFDWDDANVGHLNERHNLTADEAVEAFYAPMVLVTFQERSGEFRRIAVGRTRAGQCLVIVYVLRQQRIRILTAFPGSKRYRQFYEERMGEHG